MLLHACDCAVMSVLLVDTECVIPGLVAVLFKLALMPCKFIFVCVVHSILLRFPLCKDHLFKLNSKEAFGVQCRRCWRLCNVFSWNPRCLIFNSPILTTRRGSRRPTGMELPTGRQHPTRLIQMQKGMELPTGRRHQTWVMRGHWQCRCHQFHSMTP